MDHFKGRVAIVTGGASGIGRALCEDLGRRGAVVVVADINGAGAGQVASAVATTGGRARAAQLNVSQAEDVKKLVDETASQHGQLDYMFNNAGIGMAGEVRDTSPELWHRVVDVNLWGVIYGTTAAYALMIRQGFGHIVNTASLAGLVGCPAVVPYAATKHAVVGLSTSLRAEAADLGVKVSVVCPGYVRTDIYDVAPVLKVNREDLFARIPFKGMEATQAARVVLRGVVRNRAIIAFPFHTRFAWWLYRLCPALLSFLGRKAVGDFRALRGEL
jgi:NAD(P)-dependent dehydrogenase (short-subunit alcohol dehydrogenase family)